VAQAINLLVDCHENSHGQYDMQDQKQIVYPSAEDVYRRGDHERHHDDSLARLATARLSESIRKLTIAPQ
jgi:hypothetical protein